MQRSEAPLSAAKVDIDQRLAELMWRKKSLLNGQTQRFSGSGPPGPTLVLASVPAMGFPAMGKMGPIF